MNPFKDTIYRLSADGTKIFTLSWKNRHEPVTLAIVAGAGLQAAGMVQQGIAAKEQAETEQEIMDYNASLKEREAQAELARSREEARQFEEAGKGLLAEQRVGFAKGGVLTTTGTPAIVFEDTLAELEADRMRILEEGFLAESFRKSEAEGLRYQGRAAISRGRNLRTASFIGAGGSILTGLGTAGSYSSPLNKDLMLSRKHGIPYTP